MTSTFQLGTPTPSAQCYSERMPRHNAHRPTQVLTALVCLALGGCAAFGQGDSGLQAELAESRAQAEAEHARLEALATRLAQLEQHAQVQVSDRSTQARMERLIEQNEVMLALAGASCDKDTKVTEPVSIASFDKQEATDDKQR